MNFQNLELENHSIEPLLLGAGKIIFLCQQLENTIKICCAFLKIKDVDITIDSLFSNETTKQKYTLGQILNKMKKSINFTSSFEEKLGSFVYMRNNFVHKFWVENKIYALEDLIVSDTYNEIMRFQMRLYEETIYMTQVFIGFHYAIGKELATRENKLEEFESGIEYEIMKQYLPQFLSVIQETK